MNIRILLAIAAVVVVIAVVIAGVFFWALGGEEPEPIPDVPIVIPDSDNDGYNDQEDMWPNDPTHFPGSHETLMVAVEDIPANTLIQSGMLIEEEHPRGTFPDNAIRSSDRAMAENQISRVDIEEGDIIQRTMVYRGQQLSYLVPRFKRAVSINYDELEAVSGLVEPGDLVDVIGHFTVNRRMGGATDFTRIIVQGSKVLAVGQDYLNLPPPAPDTPGAPPPPPPPPPLYMTLAVTPREAEDLIWAENQGILRLALRSPNQTAVSSTTGTWDESLFGRAFLGDPQDVEVFLGTRWAGDVQIERTGDRIRVGLPPVGAGIGGTGGEE